MKRVLALLLMVCILCAGWVAASAAPFFIPFSPVDGLFFGMPKEEALALVEAAGWQFDYSCHGNHYYYYNVTVDQYTVPKCGLFFFTMDNGEEILRSVEYMFALSYGAEKPPHFDTLFDELEQKLTALYGSSARDRIIHLVTSFQVGNVNIRLNLYPLSTFDGKPYHVLFLSGYIDFDIFPYDGPPAAAPSNTSGF